MNNINNHHLNFPSNMDHTHKSHTNWRLFLKHLTCTIWLWRPQSDSHQHLDIWTHGYSRRIPQTVTLHHLATSDEPPAPKARQRKAPKRFTVENSENLDCRSAPSSRRWSGCCPVTAARRPETYGPRVKSRLTNDMSSSCLGVRAASL